MTAATQARPDTGVVFDPATYTEGVPFGALARSPGSRSRGDGTLISLWSLAASRSTNSGSLNPRNVSGYR